MFYGSVPAEAQAIMNKIVKAWDVTDIYVGCSGNFTLEKFIGPKADEAEAAYQESGMSRYYTTKTRNEDLADSLRMAAAASDEHEELMALRMMMANYASRAAAATGKFKSEEEKTELAMKLAEELAAYGRRNGYIGEE